MENKRKILIYGGTFNPIHKGHTHILKHFINAVEPDLILVIPTGDPPHKTSPNLVSAFHRSEMCRIALKEEGIDAIVSDIETSSKEKSYTAVTLSKLRLAYPDGEFYLSMGEDMFLTLHKWYKPEEIIKEAFICCAKRSDEEEELLKQQEYLKENYENYRGMIVNIPYLPLSSTEIRAGSFDKKRDSLTEGVFKYIFDNSLYTAVFQSKLPSAEECKVLIKPLLKEKRYHHSLCVAKKAKELSLKHGLNEEIAEIAALLHDIMKDTSIETQLKILEYSAIMLSVSEKMSPAVIHQVSGEAYLRNYLRIENEDVLKAVRNHTTGRAKMSLLEKVVFIADAVSEDRNYPSLSSIKEAAEESLDKAILVNTKSIIRDFSEKSLPIVESTVTTYNYYLKNTL